MSDDNPNYYFGPTRHTASAQSQFSDPTPIQRNAVGSISQPAGATQTSVTTGHLLNSTRRRRGGGGSGMSGLGAPAGPLSGLADAQEEIIAASGVMKDYPKKDSSSAGNRGLSAAEAEAASDADPPNPVSTGDPGSNPNHPLMSSLRGGQPRAAAAFDFFAGE
jgi:hypothetical protein